MGAIVLQDERGAAGSSPAALGWLRNRVRTHISLLVDPF